MTEQELFVEAFQLNDLAERDAYLDRACGDDTALRQRIAELLRALGRASGFLETPASGEAEVGSARDFYTDASAEGSGDVIGPYKLLELIGEGGFGVVYMAEQTEPVRRKVALKVLKPGKDTRQVVARFEAERQALALMDHPNIARVLEAGTTDAGRPYFVMELVRGIPITEFCDNKRLSARQRLNLFLSVCRAVQHAHQKGIIHRDLKPGNVLVTLHDGTPVVKVIDFGIAKALGQQLTDKTLFTGFAQMVGTPLYMSPEQAEMSGLDVDTRSDIYALGVLLYELLTGTTPLDKNRLKQLGYDELRRIIRDDEPPKPSARISTLGNAAAAVSANRDCDLKRLSQLVRGELDWIVMKCLEKDRNRRYETAAALAADVERYLCDEPVHACPPSAGYRFRKFARRNKRAVVTAAATAVGVMLALVGLATSTALIAQALKAETDAKGKLDDTLKLQRVEAYFHHITLAYNALVADDLGRARTLLGVCPDDLRGWEWRYLMRLCLVEPLVIRDEDNFEVHSIAFRHDGERLACAGGDGAVKVRNSRTGKVLQTIPAHKGYASSVAFHPDGDHLVSVGADKLAKVWDLTTEPPRNVFEQPCDAVHIYGTAYTAAFSPLEPNHLAIGHEGVLKIWDWRNKQFVGDFPAQGNQRISLAYSRDGRRLATGGWRANVNLWDPLSGGEPLRNFSTTRQVVPALAFSQDGGLLATASFVRRVDVWETESGTLLRSLPQSGLVLGVAFSPDNRLIVSAGEDKIVHVRDAASNREILGLRGHTGVCSCVTFSPDGQRLASASMDGTIRVWDATPLQGHERQDISPGFPKQSAEVFSLAVSPDGQKIVSAGLGAPAMIWDAKTKQGSQLSDHAVVGFCVAWDSNNKRIALAVASGDQFTVKVKDLDAKSERFTDPGESEYFAVAFSPDGKYLVTGNGEGRVEVWDANSLQKIYTLGTHWGVLRGVVFSPDGKLLASMSSDGKVKLWDATRLGEKENVQDPLSFTAHSPGLGLNMAFSPDGTRLATGGEENTIKIWDVGTGKELRPPLRGHSGDVSTLAFSPDGRWVASGGEDTTVKVWDSNTGKLLRSFRGHEGLVSTMAFLDGRTLITGSRDHTIRLWDLTKLDEEPNR